MKKQKVEVITEAQLSKSATKVWKLLGDFNGISNWHPAIKTSSLEQNGKVRRVSLVDGGESLEELIEYDENAQFYTYKMIDGPVPVIDYIAKLEVNKINEDRTLVRWSSEFKSKDVADAEAKNGVRGFLQAGIDNVQKIFS